LTPGPAASRSPGAAPWCRPCHPDAQPSNAQLRQIRSLLAWYGPAFGFHAFRRRHRVQHALCAIRRWYVRPDQSGTPGQATPSCRSRPDLVGRLCRCHQPGPNGDQIPRSRRLAQHRAANAMICRGCVHHGTRRSCPCRRSCLRRRSCLPRRSCLRFGRFPRCRRCLRLHRWPPDHRQDRCQRSLPPLLPPITVRAQSARVIFRLQQHSAAGHARADGRPDRGRACQNLHHKTLRAITLR
jgi:hypothetical protein